MAKSKALGKGLSALLGSGAEGRFQSEKLVRVPVKNIRPDPGQPRKEMDEEGLSSLAASIRIHGILQPLLLKALGDEFQIVAGERRWRAALMADLQEVPARVIDVSEAALREISLIENIQREDLSPLEIAAALQALMKTFDLTQEDIAERIGWNRTTVANRLRLLNLPDAVKEMLANDGISEGHARVLLALKTHESMMEFAARASDGKMTVRQLELEIKADKEGEKEDKKQDKPLPRSLLKVRLSQNLQIFAKAHGLKIKVDRQGDAAKVILDNLKGVDDEKLLAVLEDCLERLYPKGR